MLPRSILTLFLLNSILLAFGPKLLNKKNHNKETNHETNPF